MQRRRTCPPAFRARVVAIDREGAPRLSGARRHRRSHRDGRGRRAVRRSAHRARSERPASPWRAASRGRSTSDPKRARTGPGGDASEARALACQVPALPAADALVRAVAATGVDRRSSRSSAARTSASRRSSPSASGRFAETANVPGTTVSVARREVELDGRKAVLVDLPGTLTLADRSDGLPSFWRLLLERRPGRARRRSSMPATSPVICRSCLPVATSGSRSSSPRTSPTRRARGASSSTSAGSRSSSTCRSTGRSGAGARASTPRSARRSGWPRGAAEDADGRPSPHRPSPALSPRRSSVASRSWPTSWPAPDPRPRPSRRDCPGRGRRGPALGGRGGDPRRSRRSSSRSAGRSPSAGRARSSGDAPSGMPFADRLARRVDRTLAGPAAVRPGHGGDPGRDDGDRHVPRGGPRRRLGGGRLTRLIGAVVTAVVPVPGPRAGEPVGARQRPALDADGRHPVRPVVLRPPRRPRGLRLPRRDRRPHRPPVQRARAARPGGDPDPGRDRLQRAGDLRRRGCSTPGASGCSPRS